MTSPRGRGRALKRHGDVTAVQVKLDPKHKERFEALLAEMRGARRDEAGGFDAYWEAVGAIIDGELYIAGGHETADAFFKTEVKAPKRTAMRLVRVARYASPAEEAKYGTAILDLALAYIEALTGGPIKGKLPIAFDKLKIPVERGGKVIKAPLAEASLREIREATRALLVKGSKSRYRRPPGEEALAAALRAEKALAEVTVSLSDGRVRFGAVPFASLSLFARAILAATHVRSPRS
jgi:hypothetical protein